MSEGGRKRKAGQLHSAQMKTPKTEPEERQPLLEVNTEPGAEVPRPPKRRRTPGPKTPRLEVKEEPLDEVPRPPKTSKGLPEPRTAPRVEVKEEPVDELPRLAKASKRRRTPGPKTPRVEVKEEPVDEKGAEPVVLFERYPPPRVQKEVKRDEGRPGGCVSSAAEVGAVGGAEVGAGPEGTEEARRLFGRFFQLVRDPNRLFDVVKRLEDEEAAGQGSGQPDEGRETGGDEEWEDEEEEPTHPRPAELHFALMSGQASAAEVYNFFADLGYLLSRVNLILEPKSGLIMCAVVFTSEVEAATALKSFGDLEAQPASLPRGTGYLVLPWLHDNNHWAEGVFDGRGSVVLAFRILAGGAAMGQVQRFFSGGRFGHVSVRSIPGHKLFYQVGFSSVESAVEALRAYDNVKLPSGWGGLFLFCGTRYAAALQPWRGICEKRLAEFPTKSARKRAAAAKRAAAKKDRKP